MNQHVPEQPHFIQFYMEIKCLKYGMKLHWQLNTLKFCVVTNRNLEVEAKAFLLRAFPTKVVKLLNNKKYFYNRMEMNIANLLINMKWRMHWTINLM